MSTLNLKVVNDYSRTAAQTRRNRKLKSTMLSEYYDQSGQANPGMQANIVPKAQSGLIEKSEQHFLKGAQELSNMFGTLGKHLANKVNASKEEAQDKQYQEAQEAKERDQAEKAYLNTRIDSVVENQQKTAKATEISNTRIEKLLNSWLPANGGSN